MKSMIKKVREWWSSFAPRATDAWDVLMGKKTPVLSPWMMNDKVATEEPPVLREILPVDDAARIFLAKKPKFRIGDTVRLIEGVGSDRRYPKPGQTAVVVGYSKKISLGDGGLPAFTQDVILLLNHDSAGMQRFPFESWRLEKIGSIISKPMKKKSATKKKAVPKKKKSASKKTLRKARKRKSTEMQEDIKPRGLEAIQQFPQEEVADQIVKPAKKRTKRNQAEDSLAVA
ncbi:hypothetical protein [Leptospira bandrabouensis]|nr:hypothetical protein [Leptospira bandrabouensis]